MIEYLKLAYVTLSAGLFGWMMALGTVAVFIWISGKNDD